MVLLNQLQSLLPRRSAHCSHGNEAFLPDSEYFSFLVMNEKGWQREDFCPACWAKVKGKKKLSEGVEWKGKIPRKKEKMATPDERASSLFLELHNSQDLDNQKLAYVLALYLERKKQLAHRGTLKNKLCFENQESGETFAIDRLSLSKEELDRIVTTLLEKLR